MEGFRERGSGPYWEAWRKEERVKSVGVGQGGDGWHWHCPSNKLIFQDMSSQKVEALFFGPHLALSNIRDERASSQSGASRTRF